MESASHLMLNRFNRKFTLYSSTQQQSRPSSFLPFDKSSKLSPTFSQGYINYLNYFLSVIFIILPLSSCLAYRNLQHNYTTGEVRHLGRPTILNVLRI